jgi:RNA polymerase sigma factor (sigma-70 family)
MSTAPFSPLLGYLRRLGERDARALTDRQLLERFTRDRDEAAFAELVRRHGPMVLSACRRVLRHEQDAEDAFQASFLVLARKAGSVRQHDSVGGWLYQVAYRLALRSRALGGRRREQGTLTDDPPERPGRDSSQESLRICLDEELRRLPEPYRTVVVLCYVEGRSQAEAAGMLATTADAVNSRLKRARDLLRHRLARHGMLLSGVALTEALAGGAAQAALPPALVRLTARTALDFATGRVPASGTSAVAAELAKGALHDMLTPKLKLVTALALLMALLTGGLLLTPPALGDPAFQAGQKDQAKAEPATQGDGKAGPRYSVILLWMPGGPSQFETFDLKPGNANGGPFKEIETTARGVKISEHLPRLARQAKHLAILRGMTHGQGDHNLATYLMRTGREFGGDHDYPTLGSALAKELGEGRADLPGYVNLVPWTLLGPQGYGPGFHGAKYAPLEVGAIKPGVRLQKAGEQLRLPPEEAFEALEKGKGKKLREAVAKAFDLGEEKEAVRDAYGWTAFGQGCLLARRLVERGVPVVEVTLPGWDTHADCFPTVERLSGELDRGWGALLQDLHDRKKLDTTLIVWMGEFGRTPRINVRQGRDHFPHCFTVVLAGAKIKGGQAIGKTSDDGINILEGPVTPAELHATIYRAVGVDPTRENRTPGGERVPLVEKGTKAVKEALR